MRLPRLSLLSALFVIALLLIGGSWELAPRFITTALADPVQKLIEKLDSESTDSADSKSEQDQLPSFVPSHHALGANGDAIGASAAANGPALPQDAPVRQIYFEPINPQAAVPPVGAEPSNKSKPEVVAAKTLFGAAKTGSPLAARAIGTYARGCLSGAVQLANDGPTWQAMRLSRNRHWGHPRLVDLVQRLSKDAKKLDGWPGLLVGDLSQPRGGPMLTGHASHQVGLDADVWLTPMPDRTFSRKEREEISATSMLDKTDIAVDPKIFTAKHVALIKRAASYPEVERVLVHPAIKKALCLAAGNDRAWLGKVRPIGGHYYHFHIRIKCPPGFSGCRPQTPPTGEDGCGKEVDAWIAKLTPPKTPPPPKPPGYKPKPPPPPITMAQLPKECVAVLESGPDGVKIPPAVTHHPTATANASTPAQPKQAAVDKKR